eukprot:SM000218S06603  [mRNA]  locus=s218:100838:104332:+ [translate_table: standard]
MERQSSSTIRLGSSLRRPQLEILQVVRRSWEDLDLDDAGSRASSSGGSGGEGTSSRRSNGHPPLPTPGRSSTGIGRSRAGLPEIKLDLATLRSSGGPGSGGGMGGMGGEASELQARRDKFAFFEKECSKVADHVYLGSDVVAKNHDKLRECGITHVLNCVGFVCPEYFSNELEYKTLWLQARPTSNIPRLANLHGSHGCDRCPADVRTSPAAVAICLDSGSILSTCPFWSEFGFCYPWRCIAQDTPAEDITSVLYDVFDYIEEVRELKGRVFVHCYQGVSRSSSLAIGYLMWRSGASFEDVFREVKEKRGVTNPNMGFACQLLQWQKRVLDLRGAFLLHAGNLVYSWRGRECDRFMAAAADVAADQIVRYELPVGGELVPVHEGEEPAEFWDAFGRAGGGDIAEGRAGGASASPLRRPPLSTAPPAAASPAAAAAGRAADTSGEGWGVKFLAGRLSGSNLSPSVSPLRARAAAEDAVQQVAGYDYEYGIYRTAREGGAPPAVPGSVGALKLMPARDSGWGNKLRREHSRSFPSYRGNSRDAALLAAALAATHGKDFVPVTSPAAGGGSVGRQQPRGMRVGSDAAVTASAATESSSASSAEQPESSAAASGWSDESTAGRLDVADMGVAHEEEAAPSADAATESEEDEEPSSRSAVGRDGRPSESSESSDWHHPSPSPVAVARPRGARLPAVLSAPPHHLAVPSLEYPDDPGPSPGPSPSKSAASPGAGARPFAGPLSSHVASPAASPNGLRMPSSVPLPPSPPASSFSPPMHISAPIRVEPRDVSPPHFGSGGGGLLSCAPVGCGPKRVSHRSPGGGHSADGSRKKAGFGGQAAAATVARPLFVSSPREVLRRMSFPFTGPPPSSVESRDGLMPPLPGALVEWPTDTDTDKESQQ